jgi:septum formation inhibitor MinC
MLKPKSLPGTCTSLRVPIILDLSAYQHDGSPHYKPPCEGFIPSIVETLDKWGISVMGLTNVPNIETIGDDIHSLGLPVLGRVGSGRVLGKNGKKGGRDAVSIEDLVQLVLKQSNHEENVTSDTKTNYTEDADVSVDNIGTVNDDAEKCDNQVPTIGDDNTIVRDKVLSMSLSELQKACDTLGLDATGPISELYDKILTLNGLEPMQQRQPDTDASDDTIDQQARSDSFPPNVNIPPPKLYHGSVRSGQQVSTDEPNQSLVVLGNVNSGGEVISDGDIYIFGHLRGRAIAGLSESQRNVQDSACTGQGGGSGSVIVCTHFDAELVCIGESFTTMDGSLEDYGLKNGKGVIIRRNENDSLLKFMSFG